MRIWIINQYAIPLSQAGPTRHYTLARELIRKGHHVTIIASSFDHVTRRETRLTSDEISKYEVVEGVPFVWLRTPPYRGNTLARIWNMLVFASRVWRDACSRINDQPDVIIGSSPHLFGALAAERLAGRYKIPFILEVRDLWPKSLVDLGNVSDHHPVVCLLERVERYLYRKARYIVTLLPSAVDHMVEKGIHREKVVWLPNGVDFRLVSQYRPPKETSLLTVMYAGAHGLANGLDSILDTAAILEQDGWGDRVRFRLIGDGPEKVRLQQRATIEGIQIVRFEDPVPKNRIYGLLQEADAFIVTMRNISLYRYGISLNKIYDYLAVGRPIVFGSSAPNNPVAEACAGLTVQPENPREMAEAVKRLAAMSLSERIAMGQRGRAYVEKEHNFVRLAEKLEQVLLLLPHNVRE